MDEQHSLLLPLERIQMVLQSLKERPVLSSTYERIVECYVEYLPFIRWMVHAHMERPSYLLTFCVRSNCQRMDVLEWLLMEQKQQGTMLQLEPLCGITALHFACDTMNIPTTQLLLRHGADPNVRDFAGHSPLHVACRNGSMELVQLLLDMPTINVNAMGEHGETALHVACTHNHMALVQSLLLRHSTNVNAQNDQGQTALHMACLHGYLQIAECLVIRHHAQVEICSDYGWTPLHIACRQGHYEMVQFLVLQGRAQVNGKGGKRHDEDELIMMDHDLIVDEIDAKHARNTLRGETPLHLATKYGHAQIVQFLCSNHANITLTTDAGETAYDLIRRRDRSRFSNLLKAPEQPMVPTVTAKDNDSLWEMDLISLDTTTDDDDDILLETETLAMQQSATTSQRPLAQFRSSG